MFMKGYSFRQIINNGKRHYDEKEISYDGDTLEMITNDNGDVNYQRVENDDLLRLLGSHESSLMERLEQDFKIKSNSRKHNKKTKKTTAKKTKKKKANTTQKSSSKKSKTTKKSKK